MVDMDAPAKDETLTNIDINTTNLANFPRLVVCTHNDNKDLMSDHLDDISITIRITPHFKSIKAGKNHLFPPYTYRRYTNLLPWRVSVAFYPNYLLTNKS